MVMETLIVDIIILILIGYSWANSLKDRRYFSELDNAKTGSINYLYKKNSDLIQEIEKLKKENEAIKSSIEKTNENIVEKKTKEMQNFNLFNEWVGSLEE